MVLMLVPCIRIFLALLEVYTMTISLKHELEEYVTKRFFQLRNLKPSRFNLDGIRGTTIEYELNWFLNKHGIKTEPVLHNSNRKKIFDGGVYICR